MRDLIGNPAQIRNGPAAVTGREAAIAIGEI